jgi:hypothetical protein
VDVHVHVKVHVHIHAAVCSCSFPVNIHVRERIKSRNRHTARQRTLNCKKCDKIYEIGTPLQVFSSRSHAIIKQFFLFMPLKQEMKIHEILAAWILKKPHVSQLHILLKTSVDYNYFLPPFDLAGQPL